MALLSPQTWRVLGLGVGLCYIGLGTYYPAHPREGAEVFGLSPRRGSAITAASGGGSIDKPGEVIRLQLLLEAAEASHDEANAHWMNLLGARDVSMGIAVGCFYYWRDARAMATTILGGVVFYAVDVVEVWRLRGPKPALSMAAGAAVWTVIGLGVLLEGAE